MTNRRKALELIYVQMIELNEGYWKEEYFSHSIIDSDKEKISEYLEKFLIEFEKKNKLGQFSK